MNIINLICRAAGIVELCFGAFVASFFALPGLVLILLGVGFMFIPSVRKMSKQQRFINKIKSEGYM